MSSDEKQLPETRGLAQLAKLLADRTQKQLAIETGIPQSVLSDIVNRRRLPGLQQALALEKLGIAPSAWGESAAADQGAA